LGLIIIDLNAGVVLHTFAEILPIFCTSQGIIFIETTGLGRSWSWNFKIKTLPQVSRLRPQPKDQDQDLHHQVVRPGPSP